MADPKILIKFQADDKGLVTKLKQLAKAQSDFNTTVKNSTKTDLQSLRIKQTMSMALDKETAARKRVISSLKRDIIARSKLSKETGILSTRNNRLTDTNKQLAVSFATVRSKMLLVSFAMSLGVRQLSQMAASAAKVESMERAFNTLSGGVENAEEALNKLRQATDNTMTDFTLFQQANNAMILGVSKNSDEMAEMFDIAQRLGRALGRDTASSVESLITGIGRQSRLMLDNIGIIVKSEEAYQAYAKELGISADRLTDAEKKQAFLEATMESARNKIEDLGKEVSSSQDSLDRFSTSMGNLSDMVGDRVLVVLAPLADAFSVIARGIIDITPSIDEMNVSLLRMTNVIPFPLVDLMIALSKETEDAEKSIKGFNEEMLRMPQSFTRDVKLSIDSVNNLKNSFSPLINEEKFAEEQTKRLAEAQKIFNEEYARSPLISDEQREKVRRTRAQLALSLEFLSKIKKVEFDPIPDEDLEETINGAMLANRSISMVGDAMARLVMEGKSLSKLKLGDILGQMALSMAFTGLLGGWICGLFNKGFGASAFAAKGIAHTGGYINSSGNIQRFANGGVIQGEDNVPILAQSGEFVMSRKAVQSIGLETMNRINEGGGAGSVTVNVSGNVMTQDFVENDLADAIREAARRGVAFN